MIIAVQNRAGSLVSEADLQAWIAAIAVQVRDHVARAWGIAPPSVVYVAPPGGQPAPPTSWPLLIMADGDGTNALGWHWTNNGQPLGRVFVRPTLAAGEAVSAVLSHEVIEMIGDGACNLWADKSFGANPLSYAVELADPCEATTYRLTGSRVALSDFVLPAWFDPGVPKSRKTSWTGACRGPFNVARGGYAIVRQSGATREIFGAGRKAGDKPTDATRSPVAVAAVVASVAAEGPATS